MRSGVPLVVGLAVSALLHASPPLVRGVKRWLTPIPAMVERADAVPGAVDPPIEEVSQQAIAEARRTLVVWARKHRAAGTLELGEFLLRAAEIDAADLGYEVDTVEARRRYRAQLEKFRTAIANHDITSAFRQAFGKLHYQSIGGSMADLLIEGGGSCEQMAHLGAAAMYDGGLKGSAYLQYYGGGRAHLAPIYVYAGIPFDLLTGRPAHRGGVRFAADELIEIYARAHGIAGERGSGGDEGWSDGRATFAGGYPANRDAYPGLVPIFAEDAFGGVGVGGAAYSFLGSELPGGGLEEEGVEETALDRLCPLFEFDELHPSSATVLSERLEPYTVELLTIPDVGTLQWRSYYLARIEALASEYRGADDLFALACLSRGYERLAVDFALAGYAPLSKVASRRSLVMRERAVTALRKVSSKIKNEQQALLDHPLAWLLVVLPGGPHVALDALRARKTHDDKSLYGASQIVAFLLLDEESHDETIAFLESQPITFQFAVLMSQMWLADDFSAKEDDSDFGRAARALRIVWAQEQQHQPRDPEASYRALEKAGMPAAWLAELRKWREQR